MAKPHRKTIETRPVLQRAAARALAQSLELRSLLHVGAGLGATALDEWEAEGGASAPPAPDLALLQRLGAALVSEWSSLPAHLQRALYERAVGVASSPNRSAARREMACFLHDNGHVQMTGTAARPPARPAP